MAVAIDDDAGPCVALWRAVINRAMEDAVLKDPRSMDCKTARSWFEHADLSFRLVCELADIRPEYVIRRFHERLKTPQRRRKRSIDKRNSRANHAASSAGRKPALSIDRP